LKRLNVLGQFVTPNLANVEEKRRLVLPDSFAYQFPHISWDGRSQHSVVVEAVE